MTGCSHRAEHVVHGVTLRLPGHPGTVPIGDLKVCPLCFQKVRVGGRVNVRENVVASAVAKQTKTTPLPAVTIRLG